jgi:hypothetical protein
MKTCRKGLHQFTGVQCRECWNVGERARREAKRLRHPEMRRFTPEHREKLSKIKSGVPRFTKMLNRKEHITRDTFKNNNLRKYKLTVQEFAIMWLRSDGKCENPGCRRALDLDKKTWAIDHDHSCCPGAKTCGVCTRGLMCSQCNVALGYLGDSVSKALGLVSYLHSRSTPNSTSREGQ